MIPQNNTTIYISDLDGTLLRNDATISPWSREKLTELLNEGINFTIASARSVNSIKQILGPLPLTLPVIEINGAFITDYHTYKHLIINEMEKDLLNGIYDCICRNRFDHFVSTFNGTEDCLYYKNLSNPGLQWYHDNRVECGDLRLRPTKNISETFSDSVVAFTVVDTFQRLQLLDEQLREKFDGQLETHFFENIYSPPWWWLTIHDKKACKSIAIKELCEITGFSEKDTVVFGDNLNDIKMFETSLWAVAVANAIDDVKQHANEVIGSNEDDSVVKYMSNHSRNF